MANFCVGLKRSRLDCHDSFEEDDEASRRCGTTEQRPQLHDV